MFISDYINIQRGRAERRLLGNFAHLIPMDITEPRTRLYRIVEAFETRVMLCSIRTLLKEGAKSVVWLHDGIFVHKDIPPDTTRNIIRWSALKLGYNIDARFKDLNEKFENELRKENGKQGTVPRTG